MTCGKMEDNAKVPAEVQTKTITSKTKWAGSDLNQRPPPCQGSLLYRDIRSNDSLFVYKDRVKSAISHSDFWSGFQSYLSKHNNHLGTRDRLNYAIKYAYILDTGDARQLLELNNEKRIHIMKSLSALAKYTGRYDNWQRIRQNFQLKWSNGDSLGAFNSIFNKKNDLNMMLCWLKDTSSPRIQKL